MGLFKKFFSAGADYAQLVKDGAVIVDVRTKNEFAGGHIRGSVNIPLDSIQKNVSKLRGKTVITCCASGMRSASAKNMLKAAGISDVHNGGGWSSLQRKINN